MSQPYWGSSDTLVVLSVLLVPLLLGKNRH